MLSWLDDHGAGRPSDPVFVDVGANIGTTTVSALRRFGFASAVALEPSPENFRGLRLNLVANDVEERVTALHVAAATHEGTRPLDTDRRHSGGHRLARKGKAEKAKEGRVEVRVVTLDGLVQEGIVDPGRVGLLWVDAAGDEGKVICGATRLLERGVPIVAALRPRRMKPDARTALIAALEGYRFVDTAGLHPGATAHGVDELEEALAGGPRTLDLLFVSR
ncbi:MAG: FkbM family methyltransferase [Verrucomicrobiota bacterium]